MALFEGGTLSRVIAIAAVGVLTLGVAALSIAALQSGQGNAPVGEAMTPAPTFSFGRDDEATPSATPSPATEAPTASADERFLAVNGDELWRATAGACDGAAPAVEYSTDGGETWRDVTPDTTQVLALASFGDAQGEVIGAVGEQCTPDGLRTYTGGADWETNEQALANATYLDPAARGTVIDAGARIEAPCADANSVRASRGVVGLICDGAAYAVVNGAWERLTPAAIALDAVSGTIVVAHTSDDCAAGAAITRYTGTDPAHLGCIDDVDPAVPSALSVLEDDIVLWTAESIRRL